MHAAGGRSTGWTRALVLAALGLIAGAAVRADESRLGDYFGFLPLEIYKLDTRISNLLLADLRKHVKVLEHHPQTQPPPEIQHMRESFKH